MRDRWWVPAVVIASIMLVGVLGAFTTVPAWANDYSSNLVHLAVVLCIVLSVRLLSWGVALLRADAVSIRRRGGGIRRIPP